MVHEVSALRYNPWNASLWYWEIRALYAHAQASGIPTRGLQCEGVREVARLLKNRPSLGHEEVHEFARQKQMQRPCMSEHCECKKHC